jgi:hypothetical protein
VEPSAIPPRNDLGVTGEPFVRFESLRYIAGFLLPPLLGLSAGFRVCLREGDPIPLGQVQGRLTSRLEPLNEGPQIHHIAVAPATVAEEPAVRIEIETRVVILVVRVRATALEAAAGANGIKVAISNRHQIYLLTDHLEEAHPSTLRGASALLIMHSVTVPAAAIFFISFVASRKISRERFAPSPSKCKSSFQATGSISGVSIWSVIRRVLLLLLSLSSLQEISSLRRYLCTILRCSSRTCSSS